MGYRDWMLTKLKDRKTNMEVQQATAKGDALIEIHTKTGDVLIVGIIEKSGYISNHDVHNVYTSGPQTPNLVVAKSTAIWDGSAIQYARRNDMGWGSMGEISRAFYTNDYAGLQKKEYQFVENGLKNHTRVEQLERTYDRVFKIHRTLGHAPFTITLINAYELSGEEVRNAVENYGKFDAVLVTNPNGKPTGNAHAAAAEIGAEVLMWRELLVRLNKR